VRREAGIARGELASRQVAPVFGVQLKVEVFAAACVQPLRSDLG
jgi:hypothetical protein